MKSIIRVGSKIVGELDGTTFRKLVRGSLHKLRNPPAWAIDAEV